MVSCSTALPFGHRPNAYRSSKKKVVATSGPDAATNGAGQIQEESLGGGASGERFGRSRRGVSARAQAFGPEGIAFESEDVFFEYDQATLTGESRNLLQKKAGFLRKNTRKSRLPSKATAIKGAAAIIISVWGRNGPTASKITSRTWGSPVIAWPPSVMGRSSL